MIDTSGLVRALASLSPRQAKALGLMTSGIFGQHSSGSSSSAALTLSLASRLRARTERLGSTLYRQTWKSKTTPAGRLLPRHVVSVLRTKGSDSTGWPTPSTVNNGKGEDPGAKERRGMKPGLNPADAAALTSWPTPTHRDHRFANAKSFQDRTGTKKGEQLNNAVVHWQPDHPARLTASGDLLTGSGVGMSGGGQLNPALSRWLMGLPAAWDSCGATAMASYRPRRKRSSKATER
jgi:hypothetical protein